LGAYNIEEVCEKNIDSIVSADSNILYNEVHKELEQILKFSPHQQSLILGIYKLEGFSQTKIAEVLSLSPKIVQKTFI